MGEYAGYVKSANYKAHKAQYYEAVKAKRHLARIGDVLAASTESKGSCA